MLQNRQHHDPSTKYGVKIVEVTECVILQKIEKLLETLGRVIFPPNLDSKF